MNIMFDIDGSLTNYNYGYTMAYCEYCKAKGIEPVKVDYSIYSEFGKTNLTDEQTREMLSDYKDMILFSKVRPGAREFIRQLVALGHKIFIITARGCYESYGMTSTEVEHRTTEWLSQEIGPVHGVFMHTKDKAAKCKELGITLAFEDCEEQITNLSREGIKAIIVNTENNQSSQGAYRIYDFDKSTCDSICKQFLCSKTIEGIKSEKVREESLCYC